MPGLVARIMQRLRPAETRRDYSLGMGLGPILSANFVNPRIAENLSTVTACVDAIASGIGSMPALVYKHTAAGREELPNHPVAQLIRRPNDRQTWPDFIEMLLASTLLYGNGLAIIRSDNAGRATMLVPIPWPFVVPILLPSGMMAFDVTQFIAPWGGIGAPRRYLADEVVHLKDRSDDGYLGRSRLSRANEVLSTALCLQEFSAAIWRNAATPAGVLKFDGKLTPDVRTMIRTQWQEAYEGARNARKTIVLEQGGDFTPMAVSPEDAEVLASRRFTVEELCRLYQVPPPIVQDYSHNTFTNAAQAARWFASLTLLPWIRKIEAEFARVLFTDPADHLEIDMSSMLRADPETRWQGYGIAVQNGILTPNEIREGEGYNARPDGDVLRTMPGAAPAPAATLKPAPAPIPADA